MCIEMTVEEAIQVLQRVKGKKIMVSIVDLEANDNQGFSPIIKEKCIDIIKQAETILRICEQCEDVKEFDKLVQTINAYSVKQNIKKIERKGKVSTFLIVPKNNEKKRIE